MKILSLFLFFVFIPFLTQAADVEEGWTAETPTWRKVQDFRAQAEASRQAYISVSAEASGAWELLSAAEDHNLTLDLGGLTFKQVTSGEAFEAPVEVDLGQGLTLVKTCEKDVETLVGPAALQHMVAHMFGDAHAGERFARHLKAVTELFQSGQAFTPKELATAVSATISSAVSAMDQMPNSHGDSQKLQAMSRTELLFYMLYKKATRVEEEVE